MNLPPTSVVKTVHNKITREKKGRHVMRFLFRSTVKNAKNFSVLRLILNGNPGMFSIKIFSESRVF